MFLLFSSALLSLLIFYRIYVLNRAIKHYSHEDVGLENSATNQNLWLYILLPAHKEQKIVAETISYFDKLLTTINSNVKVLIITADENTEISTKSVVEDFLSKSIKNKKHFIHYHDAFEGSTKSSKLNYAVNMIRSETKNRQNDSIYFAIYDFDSRPAQGTFAEFFKKASNCLAKKGKEISVFQQVPFSCGSEMKSLGPLDFNNLFSISHIERCMAVEYYSMAQKRGSQNIDLYGVRGCMGAGLFISDKALALIGGFPSYSDDIALGYRCDWIDLGREYLKSPNVVQPAMSLASLLNQRVRIYIGVYNRFTELRWAIENGYKVKLSLGLWKIFLSFMQDNISIIRFFGGGAVALGMVKIDIGAALGFLFFIFLSQAYVFVLLLKIAEMVRGACGVDELKYNNKIFVIFYGHVIFPIVDFIANFGYLRLRIKSNPRTNKIIRYRTDR